LLSAEPDEQLAEQAMRADAFSFLTKPVSRQNITAAVRLALSKTYGWSLPGGDMPGSNLPRGDSPGDHADRDTMMGRFDPRRFRRD
jgi:DNA-binding NarL/FixJ family response regulator